MNLSFHPAMNVPGNGDIGVFREGGERPCFANRRYSLKILFITSAHNSLSQRLLVELSARGHEVRLCVTNDGVTMHSSVEQDAPDLIVAPMLKSAIPESIWSRIPCLIVHPGIKGDRGPSSLDWAIMEGAEQWGVTVLQAVAEMDAGPIWASRTFPLVDRHTSKSGIYRYEVTESAVAAVLEAVRRFSSGTFVPEELDYGRSDVNGTLRPAVKQSDRAIDWQRDSTTEVLRKLNAADSAPGVRDRLLGQDFHLFGVHREEQITGRPGDLLAQRHGAICRATVDGAVWITHLKAANAHTHAGIKLPATMLLGAAASDLPNIPVSIATGLDYASFRDITYREEGPVGFLSFDFYNGAMSTEQCNRLRNAYLYARRRPTKVSVVLGGEDFWSNGIHLNIIEAAASPAAESWNNIVAINDLICEILNTMSHLVIAGMRGNAGAGGAMLALAADYVYARSGVVLNPHYKSMGNLYGSEYWTYTLPKRVGRSKAVELTESCQPLGTTEAASIGFIDAAFSSDRAEFEREIADLARVMASDASLWVQLREKHERRLSDERRKALASYRQEELRRMRVCFFGSDPAYHQARHRFVHKAPARTAQDHWTVELSRKSAGGR